MNGLMLSSGVLVISEKVVVKCPALALPSSWLSFLLLLLGCEAVCVLDATIMPSVFPASSH